MFIFQTKGNAKERGFQQGKALKDYSWQWLMKLQEEFLQHAGVKSLKGALKKNEARLNHICQQWHSADCDSLQEAKGIAAGLGMDEQLYLALMCTNVKKLTKCTVLAFKDSSGSSIIGKTDDILEHEIGQNVIEIAVPQTGHAFVAFSFAATVWTFSGMNEHGLAAALTGIPGLNLEQDGVPTAVGARSLLRHCATVAEAMDYIKDMKINSYGFSVTLGDAEGEIAQVEKNGIGFIAIKPGANDCYVHTNDILDASLAKASPQQPEPLRSNSLRRYHSTLRWAQNNDKKLDSMLDFLSARNNCNHIIQTGQDGFFTDYRVVFLPCEKRLLYLCGYESDKVEEIAVDTI